MAERKTFKYRVEQVYQLLKLKKTLTRGDIIKELNLSPYYVVSIMETMPLFYKDVVYDKAGSVLKLVESEKGG